MDSDAVTTRDSDACSRWDTNRPARNSGRTALHLAARRGDAALAAGLVRLGAAWGLADDGGETAASQAGRPRARGEVGGRVSAQEVWLGARRRGAKLTRGMLLKESLARPEQACSCCN